MMWHLRKIHNHLELSFPFLATACQISGQNLFQVGDDVTTRISEAFHCVLTYLAYTLIE
ncbi:hypothetical protein Hanom_Chr08g00716881 [Helianthus anomalus]